MVIHQNFTFDLEILFSMQTPDSNEVSENFALLNMHYAIQMNKIN